MPIAPETDLRLKVDEDTRQAWIVYSASVRELTGEEYERVESESWSQLQDELRRLERRREQLETAAV